MSNDEQSPIAFDRWWEEARTAVIFYGTEEERATKLLCRTAWRQGAYHAMTGNLTPPTH